MSGSFVTHEECGEISRRVLEKLDSMEKRLFRDNGTLSIQTRIERHEQILHGLLWALSIIVGTVLTAAAPSSRRSTSSRSASPSVTASSDQSWCTTLTPHSRMCRRPDP